jgi:hypothetical protein
MMPKDASVKGLENFSSFGEAGDEAELLAGGFGGYRQAEILQLLEPAVVLTLRHFRCLEAEGI